MTPDRRPAPPVDILLVEDDAILVTLLLHSLHERELSTDVAGDVVEAKRLLARGAYKVVVVDLVLPDGTGFEVLDFIKSTGISSMHVIVATATDPSMLRNLDRSIVKTLFFKPLNVEHFSSYVQTLVARR